MGRVVAVSVVLAALVAGTAPGWAAAPPEMPPFSAARDDVSVMLWLRRNTSLRLGQAVVFSPDNVLVVSSDTVDAAAPSIHQVSFRQEATQVDFVGRTGGRSIRGSAQVDCTTGRVKASSIALFSGSDMRGDQITSQGPDVDWRAPVAGTASALVVREVCTPRRAPPPQTAYAPPLPRAGPTIATATLPPAPRPAPAPTPAPAPAPPPPAPAPVAPAPPRPAPAPAPPAPRAAESGMVAQISAFSSRESAMAAWAQLSQSFPNELFGKTARIEPAVVNGAQVFRTSIEGFPTEAAARSACAELMARSQACFVRRTP